MNRDSHRSNVITVRYEYWKGDVMTSQLLLPMPNIGICDILQVTLLDSGEYEVTSSETIPQSFGRGASEQDAILNYLYARLTLGSGWRK